MGKGISPGRIVVLNCKREDKWIRLGLGGYEFCKNRKQFSNRSFQITDWVNLKILKMVRLFLSMEKEKIQKVKLGFFSVQDNAPSTASRHYKGWLNPKGVNQGLAKAQGGQSRVG